MRDFLSSSEWLVSYSKVEDDALIDEIPKTMKNNSNCRNNLLEEVENFIEKLLPNLPSLQRDLYFARHKPLRPAGNRCSSVSIVNFEQVAKMNTYSKTGGWNVNLCYLNDIFETLPPPRRLSVNLNSKTYKTYQFPQYQTLSHHWIKRKNQLNNGNTSLFFGRDNNYVQPSFWGQKFVCKKIKEPFIFLKLFFWHHLSNFK